MADKDRSAGQGKGAARPKGDEEPAETRVEPKGGKAAPKGDDTPTEKPTDRPDRPEPPRADDAPKEPPDKGGTSDDPGNPDERPRRVHGVVRDGYGEPVAEGWVEVYDRDLRSEELLDRARIRKSRYEARYRASQFRRAEKGTADLVLRVVVDDEVRHTTAVHFNAPDDLEWDITIGDAPFAGPSEWDTLNETLLPLLEDLSPLELREDEQYQDVTFLAAEAGGDRLRITTWLACFHLSDKAARDDTPLPPEALYAFIRQGRPSVFYDALERDMQDPQRVALLADKLLRALAELMPDAQRALLQKAVADRLVPARLAVDFDGIVETLGAIRLRYAAGETFGGGKGTIGELIELTPEVKEQEASFLAAFTSHTGPLGELWKALVDEHGFNPEAVRRVKLTFELGFLTRNHVPLVSTLLDRFDRGDLTAKRDLARFSRDDWKQVLAEGEGDSVPANIDGETDEDRVDEFATILERRFQRAYPTTSFAAKLARSEQPPIAAAERVAAFLDANPRFQLDRYRIDHYLAEAQAPRMAATERSSVAMVADEPRVERAMVDATPDEPVRSEVDTATVDALKTVQRVFRLSPTYEAVDALLSRDIDSAQQIYFMGRGQFVEAMADAGVTTMEARRMYAKAENTYATALAYFGDYNLMLNGISPWAVPGLTLDVETEAKVATLPNLQALFGSLDYCECTHCRSVYSPAAYVVDVMRYLGDRGTQGTGANAGKSVRAVLLERRPDLGEIELSCENTNTPVPYIDLVNEILEDVVSPPAPVALADIASDLVEGPIRPAVRAELPAKGVAIAADALVYAPDSRNQWVVRDSEHAYAIARQSGALVLRRTYQTFLSAAEVRANPEYTNDRAYTKLRGEVFPLELPFDLWHVQARAYLEHLGVPQPELFTLFQRTQSAGTLSPTAVQVDTAWLGLTETQRQVLTGTQAGKQSWDYWGLAQAGNDVPNPQTPGDATTNVSGTWLAVLRHLDVLLHRSGLTYKQLLQVLDLPAVNPTGAVYVDDTGDGSGADCDTSRFTVEHLDQATLDRLHRFVRLWRTSGMAMWELDLLLPDADPSPTVVDKRITDAVLQDLARLRRLHDATGLDYRVLRSLHQPIDHVPYTDRTAEGAPAVQTLYQRLFRNKLVDAVAAFPATPDQLTGTVGERVPGMLAAFRIKQADLNAVLAHLGLTDASPLDIGVLSAVHRVAALAKAMALDIDSFLRLARLTGLDPFTSPAATLDFLDAARQVSASGFTVAALDYVLADRVAPGSGVALDDRAIVGALAALRDALKVIADAVKKAAEETDDAYVRAKLGLLPPLAADASQAEALAIVDGTWEGTTAAREARIDAWFAGVLDTTEAKTKLAAITPGLSPAQRQAAVDARFAYVQQGLEGYLLRRQKDDAIRQGLATAVDLDVPTATALLDRVRLPGATVALLRTVDDGRLVQQASDGSYAFPLDEATFPDVFDAVRLLHKDAVVVRGLQLTPSEVAWWLRGTHAADMGWMHPADPPLGTAAAVPWARWAALQQFVAWGRALPAGQATMLDFADALLDGAADSDATLTSLAELTGWSRSELDALAKGYRWIDTTAGIDVVKAELVKPANLVRLANAMAALRKLGVNASTALAWAVAEPTAADADAMKQAVKAKYDLVQWQQVIQPIQDALRERKRDALVGWLVAHPDQAKGQSWTDANGLYAFYLIDVEMSACMLTSRIKQAAASAQLFVQRCLLNLELDIVAKTDVDPKWKQWKWMKRYRVWEANRKVFLYPENWIEPELRDEKSLFFKELEDELMQNDVTQETAEQAFLAYLEKLDTVANLEIRAMFEQSISADETVLHVFGRTRSSQSPAYFYRKRINGARWTAWEPVNLDIASDHLIAGVHNRRLHLLWPQFLEKADDPGNVHTPDINAPATIPSPRKYWEVRMFWSELKKGKWTPKVLSDSYTTIYQSETAARRSNVSFRTRLAPQIQARVYTTDAPTADAPTGDSSFEKLGKQVTPRDEDVFEHLIAPADSHYANGLLVHDSSAYHFYYSVVEETGKPHSLTAHENAPAVRVLKGVWPGRTFTVLDSQAKGFRSTGSFFMWDPARTYFADYRWSSTWTYYSRAWHETHTRTFTFFVHYHPFVELFVKELNIWGIKGLLNRRIQVEPGAVPGSPVPFDFASYAPEPIVTSPRPVEDVDFTYRGAYSIYNWELFFHAPFFIANKLRANQRFEEALEWFHYIFDPTSTDTATPDPDTPQQKFWITKPFYLTTKAEYYQQKIESILLAIAKGDAELREQVKEWRDNPFNPHLIARMRTVAYQKNILIKYIETLIAWGDQLFRQDTIETINEATQLYVLAASILGPRPKSVPKKVPNPVKTFYQLQKDGIDAFGNALKEVENVLPPPSSSTTMGDESPELPRLDVLYFCIPHNEKLLKLWDDVADRLFKIRHCMNIEGVVRQLPLFEPPIDPAALVRAAAAGLDIGAALADVSAPLPLYRFTFMVQRAEDLCLQVKSLGAAVLNALERRDAEAFALLRSTHEQVMLEQARIVRELQVAEAEQAKAALEAAREMTQARRRYYRGLLDGGLNAWEVTSLALTGGAIVAETVATVLNGIGTGTSLIPEVNAGAAGFGGSPHVTLSLGGKSVTSGLTKAAEVSRGISTILQIGSAMSATIGTHNRRADEWKYLLEQAEKELPQIERQIAGADLRRRVAERELANQERLIEHASKEDEFLRSKFTNRELYDWMLNQLSTVYFQSYQLAYDVAKRAERCFRYELGLTDSGYIGFGYWDSLRKGLLAGEKLHYDIKRLETAYYEQNRREYELTKPVSLAQLDPVALLKLRLTGECFVSIPEAAFDLDYPGHYFRRLKTVGLSIPCTVGPFTAIACTLTMTSNSLRKDPTLLAGGYARDTTAADPRFRDEVAAVQSIATSTAQDDKGMFELSFRDERYLPFEGAGAVSTWHIKLNKDLPQFDFQTISDVVIHLGFTAREGGDLLRSKAVEELQGSLDEVPLAEARAGLFRVYDLRREYSDRWYTFLHPANPGDDQQLVLDDLAERLPFAVRRFATKKARRIEVVARMKGTGTYKVQLSPLGTTAADLLSAAPDATLGGWHRAAEDLTGSEVDIGSWTLKLRADAAGDFRSLPADEVDELYLVVNYTVA